jgi:hypothetical protein
VACAALAQCGVREFKTAALKPLLKATRINHLAIRGAASHRENAAHQGSPFSKVSKVRKVSKGNTVSNGSTVAIRKDIRSHPSRAQGSPIAVR